MYNNEPGAVLIAAAVLAGAEHAANAITGKSGDAVARLVDVLQRMAVREVIATDLVSPAMIAAAAKLGAR